MKLLVLIRAEFSAQFGFSLVVEDIDPNFTLGAMQAKLHKIRTDLIKEKLYDLNKKLSKPFDFTHVAVISPEGAAGLADFSRESDILMEAGLCQFSYYQATFQGKSASESILKAINKALKDHHKNPFDALVIIRGGGAASDLAWLNDYALAKAVCMAELPVFTGIGHQIDDTILDEVSFQRFDTPSKVSAFLVSTIVSNANNAMNDMVAIIKDTNKIVLLSETNVESMMKAIQASSLQTITKFESELPALLDKIKNGTMNQLNLIDQQVKSMMSEIVGLSPRNTLARGYSVVRDAKGKPITSVDQVKKNQSIVVEMRDGNVSANVKDVKNGN